MAFSMHYNMQMEKTDLCCGSDTKTEKKCNTNHDCCISSNFLVETSIFQFTQKVEKQKDLLISYTKSYDFARVCFFDYINIVRIISPPDKYLSYKNIENNFT
jgi:hypothetical protein